MAESSVTARRQKEPEASTLRHTPRPTPPKISRSPVHLLHRAGQCAEVLFAKEFAAHDLTPRQYAVLAAAEQHEGGTQTDIVLMTGIDRSTLADLVRRLVAKGLLQRRRSRQDARAYNVRLSDEGRRVLRATTDLAQRVDQRLLSAIPSADRSRLIELLDGMVRKLDPASSPNGAKSDKG
jgi:DNA-binding MarR family transcriptional regulator